MALLRRRPVCKWLLEADGVCCGQDSEDDNLKLYNLSINGTHGRLWLSEADPEEVAHFMVPVTREILDLEDVEGRRVGTCVGYFRVTLQLTLRQYTIDDRLIRIERVWAEPEYLTVFPQLEELDGHIRHLQSYINEREGGSIASQLTTLKADSLALVRPIIRNTVDHFIARERDVLTQREVARRQRQKISRRVGEDLAEIFASETRRLHETTQLLIQQYSA